MFRFSTDSLSYLTTFPFRRKGIRSSTFPFFSVFSALDALAISYRFIMCSHLYVIIALINKLTLIMKFYPQCVYFFHYFMLIFTIT